MKIYIYTVTPYPYGFAGTNRVHQLASGLIQNGVDVQLIITNPTETNKSTLNSSTRGMHHLVPFQYISATTFRSKNVLARKLIDFWCYIKVYVHILTKASKADAVLVIGGATFDFRNLLPYLCKLIQPKVFLEINEYPFVTMKNTLAKGVKSRVFYSLTLPLYDGFIVISSALRDALRHKVGEKKLIVKIPVLSGAKREEAIAGKPSDKSGANWSEAIAGKQYLLHAGSLIEAKDGISGCLKAFALAKKEMNDLMYVIAGDYQCSPDKQLIETVIEDYNLQDSVVFVGNKTKDELAVIYHYATLSIVNKPENDQNIYGFNTKIAEYVGAKIPLILSDVGENKIYFKDNTNAFLVRPNDIACIAEKIVLLCRDGELRRRIAANAYELVDSDFNPGVNMKFFIGQLEG